MFVDRDNIKYETSETITRVVLDHIFVPNVILRLVIVEGGSAFKVVVNTLCKLICVTCTPINLENYIAF